MSNVKNPTAPVATSANASSGASPLEQSVPTTEANGQAATVPPPNEATATAHKAKPAGKPRSRAAAAPKPAGTIIIPDCPEGGEETTLPRKELTFDPMFQMRAEVYNEKQVESYKELMQDGVKFPPIYVADTGVRKIVFSGFNRGEAYDRAKIGDIPCKVWKMSEADALFWALRQNAAHGLTRSKADLRKALDTFFKNPALLKQTCDDAEGKGGAHRAIATVVGSSNGKVWAWLNGNKKKLEKGVLRDKTEAELKREAEKAAEQAGATATQPAGAVQSTEPEKDAAAVHAEKVKTGSLAVVLNDFGNTVAKCQRTVEALFERGDCKQLMVDKMTANKIIVADAGDGFGRMTIPILTRIMIAVEEVQKAVQKAEQDKIAADKEAAAKAKEEEAKKKAEAKAAHAALSPEASFDPKPGDKDYAEWAARNPGAAAANEATRAAALKK